MQPPRARRIAETTVERRTVLEWIGKATVLALGAELLAACSAPPSGRSPDGASPDGTSPDRPPPAGGDVAGARSDLTFQPGSGAEGVFQGWGERTVDPQDLTSILASWRLTIDGMVETPRAYAFSELLALPRQDQTTDFHCVEGWSIYDVPWSGVHLSRLLDAARPMAGATHVTFHTVGDKYNESLPLAIALEPRTMLGYGVAGSTLPLPHGFPLRVVAPRLLGYKNAKYVARLELTDHPVNGFWVAAGYPYAGEVPPSRLRPGKY